MHCVHSGSVEIGEYVWVRVEFCFLGTPIERAEPPLARESQHRVVGAEFPVGVGERIRKPCIHKP